MKIWLYDIIEMKKKILYNINVKLCNINEKLCNINDKLFNINEK